MTFILSLGNREQFIQVSDRRLSCNGRLIDDESNKAGILLCQDARHVFGFTGLAKYKNFDTGRWLLNALYECCPPDYQINKIMPRLKDRATNDFQTIRVLKSLATGTKRLSIIFSGYNYYGNPPLGATGILTNFQDFQTGIDSSEAWDHFKMNCWTEIRPLDREFTSIQRIGAWGAMTANDEQQLRKLLLDLKPYQAISDKAVSLIREMADRPKARGTIGKQISVVIVQRDTTQHVLATYNSAKLGSKTYVPDEIIGISDTRRRAVADREVWIEGSMGPEISIIPKVYKNAPCPCQSGERYRDCHGMSSKRRRVKVPTQSSEVRYMKFTGTVRRERPDFNDDHLLKWIRENWILFARMGYGGFVSEGRGVIFINLHEARIDDDGIFFSPAYLTEKSEQMQALEMREDWLEAEGKKTRDLIATYDPEQLIILIFERKHGRVSTVYMGTDDPNFTPRHLFETVK